MADAVDRLTVAEQAIDRLTEISRGDEREPEEIQAMATLALAHAVIALVHEVRAMKRSDA
jgi:hypothetical protein